MAVAGGGGGGGGHITEVVVVAPRYVAVAAWRGGHGRGRMA